jgi:transmembrane sensor
MEALRYDVPTSSERAAEWLHRLHSADLQESEKEAFLEWLRKSPVHVREVLLALSIEDMLQRQQHSGLLAQDDDVLDSAVDFTHVVPASRQPRRSRWRMVVRFSALVASLALLLAAGYALLFDATYATGAGEWRTLALSDRSAITLGPRSRVEVDFSDRTRDVRLAAGGASFEVAEDGARPFSVRTDLATIRALGTRFAVAREDRQVVVTVARGSVVVSRQSPPHSVTVSAGEQVAVSASSDLLPRAVDAVRELAWLDRRLIFDVGTTLGDAVDAFNRLNELQLRVEDPSLAALPVRGTFNADDPHSFAEVIERSSGARLQPERGVLRILRKRTDSGASAEHGSP